MENYDFIFFSGDEETYTTINNAAAVDASAAELKLVTIPTTDHGFKAGASATNPTHVFISGSVNYNGLRKIYAVAANTITIHASYVAETFAGTETLKTMYSDNKPFNLMGFQLHLDTASATAENLAVNVDADMGAAWDINIYTKDMNTVKDVVYMFAEPIVCKANDKVDFAWVNTNDRLWGVSVIIGHRV